jgi:hypothetical protein
MLVLLQLPILISTVLTLLLMEEVFAEDTAKLIATCLSPSVLLHQDILLWELLT